MPDIRFTLLSIDALAPSLSDWSSDLRTPWFGKDNTYGRHCVNGDLELFQEHWKAAADYYKRALDVDPELATTWSRFGIALWHYGDHNRAIASYNKALSIWRRKVCETLTYIGDTLKQESPEASAVSYLNASRIGKKVLIKELIDLGYTADHVTDALNAEAGPLHETENAEFTVWDNINPEACDEIFAACRILARPLYAP